jgi:hypothetical protein
MTTVHVQTCIVGGGPAGLMNSPLFPRIQWRIFFGVPLPARSCIQFPAGYEHSVGLMLPFKPEVRSVRRKAPPLPR